MRKPTAVFSGTLDELAVHIFTVPVHLISRPHRQRVLHPFAFVVRRPPNLFSLRKSEGTMQIQSIFTLRERGSKRWGDRAVEGASERATDPKVIAHDDLPRRRLRHGEKTKGPLTRPIHHSPLRLLPFF